SISRRSAWCSSRPIGTSGRMRRKRNTTPRARWFLSSYASRAGSSSSSATSSTIPGGSDHEHHNDQQQSGPRNGLVGVIDQIQDVRHHLRDRWHSDLLGLPLLQLAAVHLPP